MTKSNGSCRVNGVSAGEISLNLLGPVPSLSMRYALENFDSGERFGSGNRNTSWSKETMERLAALVSSMEHDVCRDLFEQHQSPTDSAVESVPTLDGGVLGL